MGHIEQALVAVAVVLASLGDFVRYIIMGRPPSPAKVQHTMTLLYYSVARLACVDAGVSTAQSLTPMVCLQTSTASVFALAFAPPDGKLHPIPRTSKRLSQVHSALKVPTPPGICQPDASFALHCTLILWLFGANG